MSDVKAPLTLRDYPALFRQAINVWFNFEASRYGAAIAYYTLFAMAPVLVVIIAVSGLVFGEKAVRGELVGQISQMIGHDGAVAVQSLLAHASEPREGIFATIVGTLALLLATTGAFLELQAALNRIWNVETDPSSGFSVRSLLRRRIRSLSMVVSIGFLLTVSLAVNAAVSAAVKYFGRFAPAWPVTIVVVNQVVSIGITTLLFAIVYRVLPDVYLKWKDVAVGAFVTALLFALGQLLIGLYLGHSAVATPFGTAGTMAVILVWIFYSVQIVLLGAQFTHVYAEHRGAVPDVMPGSMRQRPAARASAYDAVNGGLP